MSTSSPIGDKGDLRLSWKIANAKGHGEWFKPEERSMLMSHVDGLNKKYGRGSHWLEINKGPKP